MAGQRTRCQRDVGAYAWFIALSVGEAGKLAILPNGRVSLLHICILALYENVDICNGVNAMRALY